MTLISLPTVPVPPEVYRVEGCTCGGGPDWHRASAPWSDVAACAIFDLPGEDAAVAVEAARQRMRDHSAELTRRLRAELAALQGEPGSST